MNNNKQSMKLYTEKQVRKMLMICHDSDLYEHISTSDDILETQTPIQIPSDEEIKKEMEYDEFDPYDVAYFGGLSYMRNLIQGGNNEP